MDSEADKKSDAGQSVDPGLICLLMMARFHGLSVEPDQIKHEYGQGTRPFGKVELLLAAKRLGLQAKAIKVDIARLHRVPLPAIAMDDAGQYFVLAKTHEDKVLIQDPKVGRPETIALEALATRGLRELILFTSRATIVGELRKFDFTWFIPAIVKHRKLLLEVMIVSFALQLFALVTPLFFQVVMDKVLVHRGFSTLDVIAVGFLAVIAFEVVLNGLRTYVFSHTTSRMDVELGARLFRHLLALPVSYFQARRVGDSVARVRELENIRAFLRGNTVTLILDLIFSVVFLAVMFHRCPATGFCRR
jgi:subfamily B ATP-binding cassette protein HlyB/CyaB